LKQNWLGIPLGETIQKEKEDLKKLDREKQRLNIKVKFGAILISGIIFV